MAGPTKVPEAGTGGDRKEGADARGRTSQSKTKQHMQLAGDRAVREKSPRDGTSQPQSLEGNSAVNRNEEPGKGSSPKVWFFAGHATSREPLSRTHPAGGCTGPQVGPERGHGLKTICTEKDLKGTWVVPTHRRGSEGDRQVDRGIEEREDGGSPQNSLHNHRSWDGGCSRNIQRLSGHRVGSAPTGWDCLPVKYEPPLSTTPKSSRHIHGTRRSLLDTDRDS